MKRVLEPEVMDTDEEADSYDAMDHSGPNQSFIERLVDLGLRGSCLDIGCGPGQVALMACGEVQDLHVTGVDLADTMLAHAQRHLQESDVAGRVVFQKADAKNLP
ncbi:MAG: class I SAM-dependent methyltransferase, partial [Planctomycetes bacterium]|nr:class I SAM-dependent methyltransferase [Planctomycetota bacterium]